MHKVLSFQQVSVPVSHRIPIFSALTTGCLVPRVGKRLAGDIKELSITWIQHEECTPCLLTSYPGMLSSYSGMLTSYPGMLTSYSGMLTNLTSRYV